MVSPGEAIAMVKAALDDDKARVVHVNKLLEMSGPNVVAVVYKSEPSYFRKTQTYQHGIRQWQWRALMDLGGSLAVVEPGRILLAHQAELTPDHVAQMAVPGEPHEPHVFFNVEDFKEL